MGISASQARLLSITARLTSNEYESQQISNAKMRLATRSQEANSTYIAALNSKQLQFTSFDAKGTAITSNLTANALYQYTDMKNQYALINASGQVLVNREDAYNFQKSNTLDEFLEAYGITKEFKNTSLAECYDKLTKEGGIKDYYTAWEKEINSIKYEKQYTDVNNNSISSDEAYQLEKFHAFNDYQKELENYNNNLAKFNSDIITKEQLNNSLKLLNASKSRYSNTITYDNWVKSQAAIDKNGDETTVYKNVQKYYDVVESMLAEAEDLGCTTIEDTYTYSDETKANWYKNLWYRMNGETSNKSAQGDAATNYSVLDSKLASSKEWLQDAITKGVISIEVASNEKMTNLIPNQDDPTSIILKGINWRATSYSSCSNILETDDNAAITRAEAEYEKATKEIAIKDKQYDNKIKTLDTEHNALKTQYESIESVISKNIDRSYKTFQG